MPKDRDGMSRSLATTQGSEADYEAIEAAVMETERGRRFLAEYARRNRHADTEVLLSAIGRIETALTLREEPSEASRFRGDLLDMARAIAATRAAAAEIVPEIDGAGKLSDVSDELDAIVAVTEQATSDILGNAEQIQDLAWTLREQGADAMLCDSLDARATGIYTACAFQDLTAQRSRKVMTTLHFIERRIRSIVEIWEVEEARLDSPMREPGSSDLEVFAPSSQADIDFVMVEGEPEAGLAPSAAAIETVAPAWSAPELPVAVAEDEVLFTAEPAPPPPTAVRPALVAVDARPEPDLNDMSLADRTRLFS
jgi:nucleoid-associated protein YgaU